MAGKVVGPTKRVRIPASERRPVVGGVKKMNQLAAERNEQRKADETRRQLAAFAGSKR